ncbi:hypothetical protein [Butyrivibrio sp. NC2002]|nr:hypothetical protein [Butyrivibrio sp. NC2002]
MAEDRKDPKYHFFDTEQPDEWGLIDGCGARMDLSLFHGGRKERL